MKRIYDKLLTPYINKFKEINKEFLENSKLTDTEIIEILFKEIKKEDSKSPKSTVKESTVSTVKVNIPVNLRKLRKSFAQVLYERGCQYNEKDLGHKYPIKYIALGYTRGSFIASLEQAEESELALFLEEDNLYAKLKNKGKIKILVDEKDHTKGIPHSSYLKLSSTLKNKKYSTTLEDRKWLYKFTFSCGYTEGAVWPNRVIGEHLIDMARALGNTQALFEQADNLPLSISRNCFDEEEHTFFLSAEEWLKKKMKLNEEAAALKNPDALVFLTQCYGMDEIFSHMFSGSFDEIRKVFYNLNFNFKF